MWQHCRHKVNGVCILVYIDRRTWFQAMSLLEAFNKDRALMPQPLANPPPLAPLPTLVTLPPDARTQEMIKEKLKKAEELG